MKQPYTGTPHMGLENQSAIPKVPGNEPGSAICRPNIVERLVFAELFQRVQPVELELGSGDGSFLAAYAKLRPECNFIGVERLLGRLRKIDRKATRAGLTNLRLIRLEAGYVLEWLIPPSSLAAIHIYFPDPWPKRRHWKRRLVTESFAQASASALIPGGVIHVRTDDSSYFEQIRGVLDANSQLRQTSSPSELLAVQTDFERTFRAEGRPIHFSAWERLPAG